MRLAFITNNASRTPAKVAEHLAKLGVAADGGRRGDLRAGGGPGAGGSVRRRRAGGVLGAAGLEDALAAAGLVPVGVATRTPWRW